MASRICRLVESTWSRRLSVRTVDEFEIETERTELEDSTNLIHSSNECVNQVSEVSSGNTDELVLIESSERAEPEERRRGCKFELEIKRKLSESSNMLIDSSNELIDELSGARLKIGDELVMNQSTMRLRRLSSSVEL